MRQVPLVDYWNSLAYPDGLPSVHCPAPPDDPVEYAEWRGTNDLQSAERERKERTAWAAIVEDAIAGRIQIYAYKGLDSIDRSADWYPGATGTARQLIPVGFFIAHNTFCAPYPTVIYIDEPGAPTIFNAPWYDPIVVAIAPDPVGRSPHRQNDDVVTWQTGMPGRPGNSKHLISDEFNRRCAAGTVSKVLAEEARSLIDWLEDTYPTAPRPEPKTVENNIREKWQKATGRRV